MLLGFPTAYFIATRSEKSRNIWLLLITIPFWTNLLIRTFAIQELIRNEGIINVVLIKLGLISHPIQMLFTDAAVLTGLTYVYFPLMVLPIYASLEKLDFRLVEAGYDLYATRRRVLWEIIVPLSKPGIIAGSILVFIPCIGAYVTPRVLGGGKNLMLGSLIEQQFGQARDWPFGSALSITLLSDSHAGVACLRPKRGKIWGVPCPLDPTGFQSDCNRVFPLSQSCASSRSIFR